MAKFEKGKSGNPGGRPKSNAKLSDLCKEFTEEIVETMVQIMRGQPIKRKTGKQDAKGVDIETEDRPSFQDRVRAAEWLADRGHGKAATVIANPDLTPIEFTISIDRKEADAPEAE